MCVAKLSDQSLLHCPHFIISGTSSRLSFQCKAMHVRAEGCALRLSRSAPRAFPPLEGTRFRAHTGGPLRDCPPTVDSSQSKAMALRWGSVVAGAASCVDSALVVVDFIFYSAVASRPDSSPRQSRRDNSTISNFPPTMGVILGRTAGIDVDTRHLTQNDPTHTPARSHLCSFLPGPHKLSYSQCLPSAPLPP